MASFLSKLGNVVEDAASFALPAALTAGGAIATGGGTLGLQGALAALGAGAQGFAANEQGERARKLQRRQGRAIDEAQEANKLAVGRANLINALKPGAGARPNLQTEINVKTPKPGFLESLAGGVGTGIQAFQTAQQLAQAADLAKTQLEGTKLRNAMGKQNIAANRLAFQQQLGAQAADAGGRVPVTREIFGKPGATVETMNLADTMAPQGVQAGFANRQRELEQMATKARQEAEDRLLNQMDTLSQIKVREEGSRLSGVRVGMDQEKLEMARQELDNAAERLDMDRTRLGLDQDRFKLQEREVQFKADQLRRETIQDLAEQEVAAVDRIVNIQPALKTADQVAASYLKVKALTQDLLSEDSETRGAGIVTLINVFNRGFVDEGAAVRAEDIDNMRRAQSALETVAARMQQFETGEAFSDELVAAIDATVEQVYDAYITAVINTTTLRLNQVNLTDEAAQSRAKNFLLAPLLQVPSARLKALSEGN